MKPPVVKDGGSKSISPSFGEDEQEMFTKNVYPFTPEEMISRTIMHKDKDGSIVQSEIVRMLKQNAGDTLKQVKFLLETKNGEQTAEEVMDFSDLCDLVKEQWWRSKQTTLEAYKCLTRSWPMKAHCW
jgi:hypothetical protein